MQQNLALTRGVEPASDITPVPRDLSGQEKAAIVVRLLLGEGTDLPLEDLPEDLQATLTQKMGQMGLVDRVTLASVVQEFADLLDGIGLSFPNGLAGALSVLDGKISPQTAARLRKEAGVRQAGDPWKRLRALPVPDLAAMAEAECTEVAAVLLSKLETAKAAELLGQLPGPLARRITYAVSQTGSVSPAAVDRIGLSLASQLDLRPIPAFEEKPGERVGAILNQSAASTRDDMLSALEEQDSDFACQVRRSIFTFAHIPERVAPRDVPAVVRVADQNALVTAISFASGEDATAVEFLLSNMSTRMADALREEAAEKPEVKQADGERAMNDIVGAVRQLQQSGDITVVSPDEET
ncbi:flagellar motor switch protein FliG [Primorskyibacter sp. S87]|uniref:flagellar motor switch protein FliG n=1 Tax=Primorskyibacter sp. S87 TaxID=3415126 RepID=UPI003C7AC892